MKNTYILCKIRDLQKCEVQKGSYRILSLHTLGIYSLFFFFFFNKEDNRYNLRYADNTTLMAESEEELKSLLMKVKEESEKVGLKTQHSEN